MLYFTIVENNFKSDFEIATAFGYSAAYLGLAFQKTGGKCISLDCYIEEFKEDFLYDENELISRAEEKKSELPFGEFKAKQVLSIKNFCVNGKFFGKK